MTSIKPTVLFSEPNRIFIELPSGKIGKDGNLSIQKGQKGPNCMFYAMKRLLTTSQIRSEHGRQCSQYRKATTDAGTEFSSQEESQRARAKANEAFLRIKGKDPQKAGREWWMCQLKEEVEEETAKDCTTAEIQDIMALLEPRILKKRPWFHLQMIDKAARQLMVDGHGLKEIPCNDLATIKGLIQTLKNKGPLIIGGSFGKYFYAGQEPIKFAEKIGTHALYGWKKGTPRSEAMGIYHMIVVVGAEEKQGKQYVYWINPYDPNDPSDHSSQRVYVSSFETIATRMVTIKRGLPLNEITPQLKAIDGGAIYNPLLSPS